MIRKILFSCANTRWMIVYLKNGYICIFELDSDRKSTADIHPDAQLVSFASSDWATYETGDDFGFFEWEDWGMRKMKLTNHTQYRTSPIKPTWGPVNVVERQEIMMKCMGVSSDGRIAIIRNGVLLSVWDVKADRFLGHLVGHSRSILSIAIHALKSSENVSRFNGKYSCISVSSDGTICVWDLNPLLEGQTYFMQR
jgi:WD40 repeat protein